MITEKCPYEKIAFINNSSLKHSIVLMACDTCKPITTVGYRVVVDLKESELQTAESLNKECWIELLENEKTDWAANLILYNLHNKDAVLLSDGDSSGWKKHSKAKEISDWKKELP